MSHNLVEQSKLNLKKMTEMLISQNYVALFTKKKKQTRCYNYFNLKINSNFIENATEYFIL